MRGTSLESGTPEDALRRERESKLQSSRGCPGLLGVLRETYQDDEAACTPYVLAEVMRFLQNFQIKQAKEIWRFKLVDQLVEYLPDLDPARVARLRDALRRQAEGSQPSPPKGYIVLPGGSLPYPTPPTAPALPSYRK